MDRKAVVAGHFYSNDKNTLREDIARLTAETGAQKKKAIAAIMPHAGYVYSGVVAGKTIAELEVPDTVVIMGPNHTGLGKPYSIVTSGVWETPLGQTFIDENLASLIVGNSQFIEEDESAHMYEHCIEVEIPFFQYINKNINIVPMVINDLILKSFKIVGEDIARAIGEFKKPVLIVASSDMTHYEPQAQAQEKDREAIDCILELNPEKLHEVVMRRNISMCGFAPVCVALYACKSLNAQAGNLVAYQTSGDFSGDYDSVVGYAGIIIS
ncbi:MAG: AmmeMemoRadiSam system protein B [Candidatus Omnitrophota bacterium]